VMFKKFLVALATSTIALSAFAVDANRVEKSVELKDGSTVHIFADGKMGVETRYGRPAYTQPGQVLETKDGQKIIMIGNETTRLDRFLNKQQY